MNKKQKELNECYLITNKELTIISSKVYQIISDFVDDKLDTQLITCIDVNYIIEQMYKELKKWNVKDE